MQDETNTTASNEQLEGTASAAGTAQHVYYEVSNDLLAKPTALCDVLEAEGAPSSVIFCGSPSDADLVDVMLKKRGISSRKLVGHVPPAKTSSTMKAARDGQLCAVVVTDVAAQNIEVEEIELVINYSIPSDPEVYIHRTGRSGLGGKRHTVMSLVSPLDIGNFHYIKKFVDAPFTKAEIPTKEDMAGVKFKALCTQAERQALQNDPSLAALAQQLVDSSQRDAVLCYLLHNTLNVLPNMKQNNEREQTRGESFDEERQSRDHGGERGDRGGRDRRDGRGGRGGRGGRDRGDRDFNRGGDFGRGRGGRNGDRNGPGHELRQSDIAGMPGVPPPVIEASDDNDFEEQYEDRPRRHDRHERHDRRDRGTPPQRDVRVYLGTGSKTGFSEEKLRSLINEHVPGASEKIKRFSQRPAYGFVDVAEEVADEVVNKLSEVEVSGSKLLVKKAVTINVPRPEMKRDDAEGAGEDSCSGFSDEGGSNEEFGSAEAAE